MDDIENDVSNAFSSLVSTAAPAVIAGAENYAAQQLTQSANATTAQAVAAAAAKPPATGIMASIESAFATNQVGALVKNNWEYILGGVAILGIGAYFVFRK